MVKMLKLYFVFNLRENLSKLCNIGITNLTYVFVGY